MKKPIAITAGEPAGIGYDILIQAAQKNRSGSPWLIFADPDVLQQRAQALNLPMTIEIAADFFRITNDAKRLSVWPTPCAKAVMPGALNVDNAQAVINGLSSACDLCLNNRVAALLTLPVHKGIINQSGLPFSGHTEFFAQRSKVEKVVMMLAAKNCRVALVTTHLPLNQVSQAITEKNIRDTLTILSMHLKRFHGCAQPTILVSGLNPHAGENGHLGKEEQEIIEPTLHALRTELSAHLIGPLPADTLFQKKYLATADAIVAMYHDQGLAPLKAMHFGDIVNISCGLPFIRTSVDHGVALDTAATGQASIQSFLAALAVTEEMIVRA
jgi:4-hydroxythreonine-4-phosphate dehydrogenase